MNGEQELTILHDDDGPAADAPLRTLDESGELVTAEVAEQGLPKGTKVLDDGSIEFTPRRKVAIKYKSADGSVREEPYPVLVFRRLKGADLRAVMDYEGKNPGDFLLGKALNVTVAKAGLIFDAADGPDSRAMLDIVSFLSGNGQKTGG
jgi:hypothetical protein